ncbi:response regulator [Luteibacter sp. PPL201]|jgi:two-component system OmpR family response regulator|uniref:Response regulator n=1 Tax=Luteibacter sahnii TaxID=3021977 RepID=A0ABT6B8U2_9GAMM|nr:response regulator [Luteibacter sp. PPL193]MDY1549433.1 response regulator [Luteibacter sp. PPL193]
MTNRRNLILVVEDDDSVRDAIVGYLIRHDLEAMGARDAVAFDALASGHRADLVILDVMLPGEDGLSLCRRLRGSGVPVLMLSALADTTDRIVGLELGAADYLAKPFDPRELLARVRAILRRDTSVSTGKDHVFRFDGWVFEPIAARLLAPDGSNVAMTAGDLRMLWAFVRHAGQVLSRERLLDLTRDASEGPFDRAIDLAVSRLRRRLADAGGTPLIDTVRGLGYRFRPRVSAS